MNTIELDRYARFDRRRGRNDYSSPCRRTRHNRLEVIAQLSASLPFLPSDSPHRNTMSDRAKAERKLTGLLRQASAAGATVPELAGASGLTREAVRGKLIVPSPNNWKWNRI